MYGLSVYLVGIMPEAPGGLAGGELFSELLGRCVIGGWGYSRYIGTYAIAPTINHKENQDRLNI